MELCIKTFTKNINSHRAKFFYYALISVFGLLISSTIFYFCLSIVNITVFYSNWIGDLVALLFVFVCSWFFIFDHSKKKFSIKLIFNLIAKLMVIYLISIMLYTISTYLDISSIFQEFNASQRDFILTFVKILLAPVSLLANYFFTFIIIEKLYKR